MTDPSWSGNQPALAGMGEDSAIETGHPAVDYVLNELAAAEERPPAEQLAHYEATHRVLTETLGTIDQG
jgi:hypothetical protein